MIESSTAGTISDKWMASPPTKYGWVCPTCARANGPHVDSCDHKPPQQSLPLPYPQAPYPYYPIPVYPSYPSPWTPATPTFPGHEFICEEPITITCFATDGTPINYT